MLLLLFWLIWEIEVGRGRRKINITSDAHSSSLSVAKKPSPPHALLLFGWRRRYIYIFFHSSSRRSWTSASLLASLADSPQRLNVKIVASSSSFSACWHSLIQYGSSFLKKHRIFSLSKIFLIHLINESTSME